MSAGMFDRLIRNVSNLLFPSRSNSATLPLDQPEQFGERKLFDSCPGDCSGVFHREETESQKRNIIGPGVFAVSPSLSLSLSLSHTHTLSMRSTLFAAISR